MTDPRPRKFSATALAWQSFPGKAISIAPAIEKAEGGPLSCYFARFGQGETAPLPVPYAEIWVVVSGALTITSADAVLTARAGEFLHVPAEAPGQVTADADTELVCIAVPAQ